MSEWRDISTAPRDGVFVLLHNDHWSSDVEGFWHKGSQSWSANTRIPGIERPKSLLASVIVASVNWVNEAVTHRNSLRYFRQ
jgi:hypothetical protein